MALNMQNQFSIMAIPIGIEIEFAKYSGVGGILWNILGTILSQIISSFLSLFSGLRGSRVYRHHRKYHGSCWEKCQISVFREEFRIL